jgi:hypothetical protein
MVAVELKLEQPSDAVLIMRKIGYEPKGIKVNGKTVSGIVDQDGDRVDLKTFVPGK